MSSVQIKLPVVEIEAFCKKWKIKEFALFGSVLENTFNPNSSDIDVLISFKDDVVWGWEIVTMKAELEQIFKRPVDLLEKEGVEKSKNELRKKSILDNYQVIYEIAA
jgi:predicted nucleotidyltransferase